MARLRLTGTINGIDNLDIKGIVKPMSSHQIIQTAEIVSKGKTIAIEVALTEDADFVVIENGLWNGKSYLTQAEARAYANRVWTHIRNAERKAA
jgi:hypothetical protein